MLNLVIVFFICFASLAHSQSYGILKTASYKSSYLVYDGGDFEEVEVSVEIKKDVKGKGGRLISSLSMKIGKIKVDVPSELFKENYEISIDTMVVAKDFPKDKSYDYFIQVLNEKGGAVENIVFKFKNGSFVKVDLYDSNGKHETRK